MRVFVKEINDALIHEVIGLMNTDLTYHKNQHSI